MSSNHSKFQKRQVTIRLCKPSTDRLPFVYACLLIDKTFSHHFSPFTSLRRTQVLPACRSSFSFAIVFRRIYTITLVILKIVLSCVAFSANNFSSTKIIGYISFPVVLLYIACTLTISNFEIVTLCTMIVWIGIPGGISYIHFFKKYHGTLE